MTLVPNRLALAAVLATVGALAIFSAPAGATVTSQVANSALTVSSNADADTITLGAAGGLITVNGTATTLQANDNAQIVVEAGGGNDTLDASALAAAAYAELNLNGGDGDDLITGGFDNDSLEGDAGDDRLIGFRGGDEAGGGLGNDVMVWNNGDGTDDNDGDAGNDEVEVNGAPTLGDEFIASPGIEPGRVEFTRTNLNPFGIDLSAERLTVNGLGGDEVFGNDGIVPPGLAGLTSLTLNGGTGLDILNGGDGPDVINGGDGLDSLDGGPGDDRVVGDRGPDTLRGGEGDDLLVWNNGDGSDFLTGDGGFDRAEVNGSATAGDTLTLAPTDPDEARFERTNLVPFSLDIIDDTEAIAVNGGGGNDQFTVLPGLAKTLVAADGGSGDDQLTGSEEADSFVGGSGSDGIMPGGGSDVADGGADDDRLFARDSVGDLVRGGAGTDHAQTDAINVDAISEVEALDALPSRDTTALAPDLGEVRVDRKRGKLFALVPVTCPAVETGGCRTTLTLETAKAIRVSGVRAPFVLGSKTADVGAGQSATVRVRLARGTAELAKRGKLPARVRLLSADAAGNAATRSVEIGLRIPRR